jgi:L-cysteine S-thiosulfotransferase
VPNSADRRFAVAASPGAAASQRRALATALAALLTLAAWPCVTRAHTVVGDGMPTALSAESGNAERGRAIVTSRQTGLCLLCHSGPFPEEPAQGNLSTHLAGAGSRWTEAQLRLRVADARRLNPSSLMPSFHPAQLPDDNAARVGANWRGRPVLSAQQVEDVVAFLKTLR